MARIDQIRIDTFRGASKTLALQFSPKKSLAVIFGENGTGKTTIVDAIDVVANQNVGSIRDRSSTTAGRHAHTIGTNQAAISIELKSDNRTWTATMKGGQFAVSPDSPPSVRVLRKSNLQRFIDAKPADRYTELKHLIAVDRVEKSEQALKEAASVANAEAGRHSDIRASAESSLERIWQEAGSPSSNSIAWAQNETSQDQPNYQRQVSQLSKLVEALRSVIRAHSDHEQATLQLGKASRDRESVELEIANFSGLDANRTIGLVEVLRDVQSLFERDASLAICPVCERPIILAELNGSIAARLRELDAFQLLAQRRRAANEQVSRRTENLDGQARLFVEQARNATGIASAKVELLEVHADTEALLAEGDVKIDDLVGLAVLVADASEQRVESLANKRDQVNQVLGRVTALSESLRRIDNATEQALKASTRKKRLDQILTVVRDQRRTFSQQLLDDVAGECNRLFELIHPGEGLAISGLTLDPKQRASLNQTVLFAGHDDVPPQAYFSESHLDTLGFCFWLAVAKRDSLREPLVVVIDDVFTSVDAPHLTRITELIVNESTSFPQVILTTHQRTVWEKFRNSQGGGKQAHLIELHSNWSLERGIATSNAQLAPEEIQAVLDCQPFDRQSAVSKAGIMLEEILDNLALLYRCKLPRTLTGHGLNELLDGTSNLTKKLTLEGTNGHPAPTPGEIIERIRRNNHVRNQVGAHSNPRGHEISDNDVREFAVLAISFQESVTCRTCGRIPSKPDSSGFRCSCPIGKRTTMSPRLLD